MAKTLPELGTMIARVTQDPDAGFEVLLTAPDGTTSVFCSEPRAREGLVGPVVLDRHGLAVIATAVGGLVRYGPTAPPSQPKSGETP